MVAAASGQAEDVDRVGIELFAAELEPRGLAIGQGEGVGGGGHQGARREGVEVAVVLVDLDGVFRGAGAAVGPLDGDDVQPIPGAQCACGEGLADTRISSCRTQRCRAVALAGAQLQGECLQLQDDVADVAEGVARLRDLQHRITREADAVHLRIGAWLVVVEDLDRGLVGHAHLVGGGGRDRDRDILDALKQRVIDQAKRKLRARRPIGDGDAPGWGDIVLACGGGAAQCEIDNKITRGDVDAAIDEEKQPVGCTLAAVGISPGADAHGLTTAVIVADHEGRRVVGADAVARRRQQCQDHRLLVFDLAVVDEGNPQAVQAVAGRPDRHVDRPAGRDVIDASSGRARQGVVHRDGVTGLALGLDGYKAGGAAGLGGVAQGVGLDVRPVVVEDFDGGDMGFGIDVVACREVGEDQRDGLGGLAGVVVDRHDRHRHRPLAGGDDHLAAQCRVVDAVEGGAELVVVDQEVCIQGPGAGDQEDAEVASCLGGHRVDGFHADLGQIVVVQRDPAAAIAGADVIGVAGSQRNGELFAGLDGGVIEQRHRQFHRLLPGGEGDGGGFGSGRDIGNPAAAIDQVHGERRVEPGAETLEHEHGAIAAFGGKAIAGLNRDQWLGARGLGRQ